MKPTTKRGKHGTLYLYEIVYTDDCDPCCPEFKTRKWAYSLEHVEEKFFDGEEGWKILRIARVPADAGMHRAVQHEIERR